MTRYELVRVREECALRNEGSRLTPDELYRDALGVGERAEMDGRDGYVAAFERLEALTPEEDAE